MGLLNWLLARFLDGMIEGEELPESMAILGIALLVAAACTLTALITWAVTQGRFEDDEPEVEEAPAPSADATEEIPRWVAERMAYERSRPKPAPRHRAPRPHVAPVQCEAETAVIPVVDPDATAVLPGGRRG